MVETTKLPYLPLPALRTPAPTFFPPPLLLRVLFVFLLDVLELCLLPKNLLPMISVVCYKVKTNKFYESISKKPALYGDLLRYKYMTSFYPSPAKYSLRKTLTKRRCSCSIFPAIHYLQYMEKRPASLGKYALQGGGIALVFVVIFLLLVLLIGNVFVFLPMIAVPIGGTLGGIIYYQMVYIWFPNGKKKMLVTGISMLIYLGLLWGCLVLALSATGHWD